MGIDNTSMVTAKTTTSQHKGTRMDSPDSLRPSATLDFKPSTLKVFNPENKSGNEINNTAKQQEVAEQLHVISKEGDRTAPQIKTIAEAVPGKTVLAAGLGDAHNISSKISALACFIAALGTKVLPKDSPLLKTLIAVADISAKLTIAGLSTVRGLYDAIINGKPLVAFAQIVNGIVSILVPTTEMTNARGAPIGMLNAFQGAEMIDNGKYAKESYNSIGDHLSHQFQAWKSGANQLRRNPMAILDSSQKGLKATCIGSLMFFATVAYGATRPFSKTVSQWFAAARDALGILVETEGLQAAHFKEGRIDLVTKSAKFSLGSAFNLLSKLSPDHAKFFSLINLGLNASGNSDQMRSLARNEQNHIGNPMSVMDVIRNGLESMVTFRSGMGRQLQKAAPVVVSQAQQTKKVQEEIKAVQKSQAQASMNHSREAYTTGLPVSRSSSRANVARNPASVVAAQVDANRNNQTATSRQPVTPSVSAERVQVSAAKAPVAPTVDLLRASKTLMRAGQAASQAQGANNANLSTNLSNPLRALEVASKPTAVVPPSKAATGQTGS